MEIMSYIHKKIWLVTLLIVIGTGCDVLDQEPQDLISTNEAIVDEQSAEAALVGLYDALQDGDYYGGRYVMAVEMLAQNARAAAFQQFWQELASGRVPASNFHVEDFYISGYAVINTANAIIESVPEIIDLSDSQKDRIVGSAYFIRGMAYFDLLRLYGEFDTPGSTFGVSISLMPSVSAAEIPRSSVAETYQQIESDLTAAIDRLGNTGNKILASRGAAQGLLARVYLYQENYQQAADLATAVINNSNYSLTPNYNDIYLNEGSPESIFEVDFIPLEDPNAWASEMYVTPPEVTVSDDLENFILFEDERSELFEEVNGFFRCTKYGFTRDDTGGNTIVLRISEMYLLRAEALGMLGQPVDALDDINAVTVRAGLSPYEEEDLQSDFDLIDILLTERRAEFAFEGQYWFDLVRLGVMSEVLDRESFRRIMPIPQRELNITNGILVQNPGYQSE
jgi:starch-binding outer membrane protein, SusD/RagB family